MRSASYTGQFKRDVKLAEKRGKDMSKLRTVISLLLDGKILLWQMKYMDSAPIVF